MKQLYCYHVYTNSDWRIDNLVKIFNTCLIRHDLQSSIFLIQKLTQRAETKLAVSAHFWHTHQVFTIKTQGNCIPCFATRSEFSVPYYIANVFYCSLEKNFSWFFQLHYSATSSLHAYTFAWSAHSLEITIRIRRQMTENFLHCERSQHRRKWMNGSN